TCVTAPEVTEGPYYVNNELVRNDIRETQGGIDLLLDIGVIDTTTCQPLDQAFVEIWSCNATGSYAGFTQANAGGGSQNMTDQNTFLRGGIPTNENGILEFKTIYPGFYTGRTIHIHAMCGAEFDSLGLFSTIGSKLGDIFFEEELNDQVVALPVYANTTQRRTLNSQDGILAEANTDGYNSFADTELLGETVADGVLAYITIGVDTTHHVNISSTNYASTILWGATTPLATATDAINMF
ncbi:aromatic compound dioxygenase, partial [Ceratobasidium sp. AG-I]